MSTSPPPSSLTSGQIDQVVADLLRGGDKRTKDAAAESSLPEAPAPVHVVYGGAHL
ncbi:MAG: hypothetical protein QOI41_5210 [Myxococcales bacterium]|nr:hypothetical protein [Myxococcales bacterium]